MYTKGIMLNTPYNAKENCILKMCKDKVNHNSDLSNVELDPGPAMRRNRQTAWNED